MNKGLAKKKHQLLVSTAVKGTSVGMTVKSCYAKLSGHSLVLTLQIAQTVHALSAHN